MWDLAVRPGAGGGRLIQTVCEQFVNGFSANYSRNRLNRCNQANCISPNCSPNPSQTLHNPSRWLLQHQQVITSTTLITYPIARGQNRISNSKSEGLLSLLYNLVLVQSPRSGAYRQLCTVRRKRKAANSIIMLKRVEKCPVFCIQYLYGAVKPSVGKHMAIR